MEYSFQLLKRAEIYPETFMQEGNVEPDCRKITAVAFTSLFFIFCSGCYTVTAGTSQSVCSTAASCSSSDIVKAIHRCIVRGGGTVRIPACQADDTWTGSDFIEVSTNVPYRLKGAGKNATVIGYRDGARPKKDAGMIFRGRGLLEIADFTFRGSDTSGISTGILVYANDTENLRIHHLKIQKFKNSALALCQNPDSPIVVDHCEIGDQFDRHMYGIRTHGTNRREDYKLPASFGTKNPNALFIEDNIFDNCYHSVSGFAVSNVVFRHNTVRNPTSHLDGHGPCYDVGCNRGGSRIRTGTYIYEIYDNDFSRDGHWCINLRGGTGIVTGNTFHDCGVAFRLEMEGCSPGAGCIAANDCPHSATDTSQCYQSPYPYWIWNNTYDNVRDRIGTSGHDCIREGYEYFNRAPGPGDIVSTYERYPYPHPLVPTDSGDRRE